MNTPTITTNRLILRKFTKDDLEAFYRIYQDEKVNTFLPWFPLKSLEEAKDFLTKDTKAFMIKKRATNMQFV